MLSYHEMIRKRSDFENLPFKDDLTTPHLLHNFYNTSIDRKVSLWLFTAETHWPTHAFRVHLVISTSNSALIFIYQTTGLVWSWKDWLNLCELFWDSGCSRASGWRSDCWVEMKKTRKRMNGMRRMKLWAGAIYLPALWQSGHLQTRWWRGLCGSSSRGSSGNALQRGHNCAG